MVLGFGDWGLGIGDWGLGPNPQSPIPNPQSPYAYKLFRKKLKQEKNNINLNNKIISYLFYLPKNSFSFLNIILLKLLGGITHFSFLKFKY